MDCQIGCALYVDNSMLELLDWVNSMSISVMDIPLAGAKEYKKFFFTSYIYVGRLNICCDIFTMG